MKYLISLLLLVPFCNAKNIKKYRPIEGAWCLVEKVTTDETNYGRIELSKDGNITLFSRADTIYSYKYQLWESDLLIIRYANNDTLRSHILKLNSDSLVLSSLIEKTTPQTYHRCKNK